MELDDRIRLEIAADGLVAHLVVLRRHPSHPVRSKHLLAFVESQGARYGVASHLLEEFLRRWRRSEIRDPFLVAQGDPPVAGRRGGLKRLHPPARSGKDPVELLPLYVKAGEAVIAVEPGKSGRVGKSVTGDPISPPTESRGDGLAPGEGLEVRGDVWHALHTGFLVEVGGSVVVTSTLTHLHDLPVAEYHWDGDVDIHGSVPSGSKIWTSGSITIAESVQSGVLLEAGGGLRVDGHVQGGGVTRLKSGGEIRLGSARGARLTADGDVRVEGLCEECQVRARGRFIADGRDSVVVGGKVESVKGAVFRHLGNPLGIRTVVTVGSSEWIDDEVQLLERQVRRWKMYYTKLYQDFREGHRHLLEERSRIYRLSPRERRDYETAHEAVLEEQRRVDEMISDLKTQQATLETGRERDESAVIRVEGRAHYGALLSIRGKLFPVPKTGLGEVTLHISPTSGKVLPIPTSLEDSSEIQLYR